MEGQRQDLILVIDSDERALSAIKDLLVSDGFDVTTALGITAAVNSLQSREYDLVLVDDHLADLTSSCFLKQLLRIPRKTPVIVMESAPARPCGLAPYNAVRANRFVNKWRACEILEAARGAQSARLVLESDQPEH
jgi:CheY-like chemotaxis protein